MLSNNVGCVIARSNEAKDLGFKMDDPYHQNRDKIRAHNVAVFSSNYTLYGDMSRRVMATLEAGAPAVEVYSIDEAFLDLSGIATPTRDRFAREIRAQVRQDSGMTVAAIDRLVHHSTIFELHKVESYRGKQAARDQKQQRDNDKAHRQRQPSGDNDNQTQEIAS